MQRNELLETNKDIGDEVIDVALRPQKLSEFIGQKKIRENLDIFIQAARQRGDAMDHVLLHGPPGLGKTTLSQIVAKELGVHFLSTSGPIIAKAGDLAAILTNIQPKGVLFIDEIHRLNPAVEEILYPAMEDLQLDIMIGEGPAARSVKIDLPPFTLIGATTRSGLITTPLRARFGIPVQLEFYKVEELELIVSRNAKLLNLELTADGAHEIAKRSRGTPRIAGRLLRRVRDIAMVAGKSPVDKFIADAALTRLDVDGYGFDAQDRRYIDCIYKLFDGGPVGIDTLAVALSEQRDTLEEVIEPYLIQQGILMRTSRGRILGKAGWDYLGIKPSTKEKAMDIIDMIDQERVD